MAVIPSTQEVIPFWSFSNSFPLFVGSVISFASAPITVDISATSKTSRRFFTDFSSSCGPVTMTRLLVGEIAVALIFTSGSFSKC